MKPSLRFIILAITSCSSLGFAEEEQTRSSPKDTTTRILGDLPDGTPPPPEAPEPAFNVPAKDILKTEIHQQGGRAITVREITPIALPPPAAPASIDLNDPALQQRIAERRAKHPKMKLLLVGATVYHSADTPPRTLVRIWPQAQGEPVTLWSSADFSLLSGLPSFTTSSGGTSSLMMQWSITNLTRRNALQRNIASQFHASAIPAFPDGKATYIITAGNPAAETLASIQDLHDLYNNEHARLLTAYQGREQARLQKAAELKAHPPKPKDIVLNHWDINETTAAEGGGK